MTGDARAVLAQRLRWQADWCARLGSPLYAGLLERCAEDLERGGPVWSVLGGFERLPQDSLVPLRLMGAVHRLILEGRAPALARHFPSVGGHPDDAWPDFVAVVEEQAQTVRTLVHRPVQTNEVGRSAVMLGAFLKIVEETGRPLRLLEVGASAGLNLRWDRYWYESATWAWGDPSSPVRFVEVFEGRTPLQPEVEIADRRGCDLDPVDPATEDGRLTLLSYTWPDQLERLARLRGALEVAGSVPAPVDRADASTWLREQLRDPTPGVATVVFHSIVLMYLDDAERDRFRAVLAEAATRATEEAPLARIGMELEDGRFPVRLRLWPGGQERVLADAGPHGPPVRWLG